LVTRSEGLLGLRIGDAIRAACHPDGSAGTSVVVMTAAGAMLTEALPPVGERVARASTRTAVDTTTKVDALVAELFEQEGSSLVRLARLFVDDRNAAEDLVQEAFIRLARSVQRIDDRTKAPAYLRSIVLNLARDHNRRGLVSLRHHLPFDETRASAEDEIVLSDDRRRIIDALRELPLRQRSCLVLRYYEELGIDDIAAVLGISRNSVKTHLKRGLAAMEQRL
jgi:RNA polymerase sigma-70 factor (sigma-E family)